TENAQEEIKNANYPKIRHFEVPKAISYSPHDDLEREAKWQQTNPSNVGRFTAVGYYYAKELQKEVDIPIGLIHSSWGGTDIETWMSHTVLESSDLFSKGDGLQRRQIGLSELIQQRKRQIIEKLKDMHGGGEFPDAAIIS